MNSVIFSKVYSEPEFCQKEILHYAGCGQANSELLSLCEDCIKEVRSQLTYKVCYRELDVAISNDCCDFGVFSLHSKNLAANLSGCEKVIVFAATVGVGIDRLITKYGHISPSRALMISAIGAERIEALCDMFCNDISKAMKVGLKPRFSPGYGDLSINTQKNIFSVLDCSKRIGISLNDSMLMSPSKSVTAFIGITDNEGEQSINKCNACNKKDCAFRGAL